ncbi:MATE efflux family protein [Peniophora sp. CONT]|nr:MATE efflux family protein [Peniophora sp. CONT]
MPSDSSTSTLTPNETTSLLTHTSSTFTEVAHSPDHSTTLNARSTGRELLLLLRDSTPVVFSYVLQHSVCTIAVVVAGRLGPEELSIAAFSLMLTFVTGKCFVVALGGSTALDTLGSQAFTGGKRSTDLSVHFLRSIVVLWTFFLPIAVLWIYAEPILLALGQEHYIARGTQSFLRVMILGMPAYIAFESLKKYLQCQGIIHAPTVVLLAAFPINVALNIALVHYTPLAIMGTPLAVSLTFYIAFSLLAVYTARSSQHRKNQTWGGFRFRVILNFRGCLSFTKLALPGVLMVGTEWAAFEIVALAAGRLGSTSLAAQSIIMTSDQSVAASARVGSLIGSRSAAGARFAGHLSALASVLAGTIVMAVLLATKNVFPFMFTDDRQVAQLVSQVMPLLASFQIADGLAGSCGGVLRGQGRQHLGAVFNIIAYYVLALPIGISLAFRYGFGLAGLWTGQVIALFVVGFAEYAVVWLGTDWEQEVKRGVERNAAEALRQQTLVVNNGVRV